MVGGTPVGNHCKQLIGTNGKIAAMHLSPIERSQIVSISSLILFVSSNKCDSTNTKLGMGAMMFFVLPKHKLVIWWYVYFMTL